MKECCGAIFPPVCRFAQPKGAGAGHRRNGGHQSGGTAAGRRTDRPTRRFLAGCADRLCVRAGRRCGRGGVAGAVSGGAGGRHSGQCRRSARAQQLHSAGDHRSRSGVGGDFHLRHRTGAGAAVAGEDRSVGAAGLRKAGGAGGSLQSRNAGALPGDFGTARRVGTAARRRCSSLDAGRAGGSGRGRLRARAGRRRHAAGDRLSGWRRARGCRSANPAGASAARRGRRDRA